MISRVEFGWLVSLDTPVLHFRRHADSVGYAKRWRQRLSEWQAVRSACSRCGLGFDRPSAEDDDTATIHEIHRKWGWWAIGNVGTARHYALKALRGAPLDREAWHLFSPARVQGIDAKAVVAGRVGTPEPQHRGYAAAGAIMGILKD